MLPKEKDEVYIQSYKHDGSLHRTWAKGFVIEASDERIVAITDLTWVIEADKRRWLTREPAICFFYPDRWYNVICMIRKRGIYYYCNLASPSIYDGEAIKNIDYDLDIKVDSEYGYFVLDEDEYAEHAESMGYSKEVCQVVERAMEKLKCDIEEHASPFDHNEINQLYERYLKLKKHKGGNKNV